MVADFDIDAFLLAIGNDAEAMLQADAAERDLCKASFYEFVVSFWDVVIKETPVFNWHIPYLCSELQALSHCIIKREPKPYDLIINIPPGTTKTTITTIMFPAWLWTQDPSIRIITNSYSMDLSIEHAVKSRDIILSEKYRRLFPEVVVRKDKGAKSMYETTQTGARYTTSTNGTITGKHAHVVISDDPINPSQALSDADRNTANEHTKTLSSRKVDKRNTPMITIMQRLHEMDPTGYLKAKKGDKIRHICLPAELSDAVQPESVRASYVNGLLDPVRLSEEVLAEARVDLGSKGYANQFDQAPVADGGNIVKEEWFQCISPDTFTRLRGNPRHHPIVFFGDTAYTENSEDNDPSGFIGTCKIGNDLYITVAKKVFLIFPKLIKFLPDWCRANGYADQSSLRIEPKANGLSIVQQLKSSTDLSVLSTPSPKDDKKTRLEAVSPKIEAGRVYLVTGAWNDEFVGEICGFPSKTHDEYVDILSYAINYHLDKAKGLTGSQIAGMLGR